MFELNNKRGIQLVEKLREGHMLGYPGVAFLVKKALATGDFSLLEGFLKRYPSITALAERNINMSNFQRVDNPFRPYPDRDDAREYLTGPLKLGYVNEFNDMFGIDYNVFSMPGINAGRVGSGKSVLDKYMVCQILRKERGFNVITPDLKREYRNLIPYCQSLKVLKRDEVRINAFQVPYWRDPRDHISAVARVFVSSNYLVGTSMNELIKVFHLLYKARGIFDGSNDYPTIIDVFNMIGGMLNTMALT